MLAEELKDPTPRVFGRGLVVAESRDAHQRLTGQFVREAVPGARVGLDIGGDVLAAVTLRSRLAAPIPSGSRVPKLATIGHAPFSVSLRWRGSGVP